MENMQKITIPENSVPIIKHHANQSYSQFRIYRCHPIKYTGLFFT
jgi:hypothetical protein